MTEATTPRARSFGAVSEAYERYRPGPAPAALDWLVPAGAQAVLDVGAGTGALTRLLAARVGAVTAVEPDDRMRAVLARQVPTATVLAGVAEELPVGDASQDAVLASASWHWVDPARAVPEVRRVLRPGGRLGIVWTSLDRDVDWVQELWTWLRPDGPAREAATRDHVAGRGPRALTLPDGAAFGPVEGPHEARYVRRFTIDDLIGLAGTYSGLIVEPEGARRAFLRELRRTLVTDPRYVDPAGVDVPVRSRCWRADAAADGQPAVSSSFSDS